MRCAFSARTIIINHCLCVCHIYTRHVDFIQCLPRKEFGLADCDTSYIIHDLPIPLYTISWPEPRHTLYINDIDQIKRVNFFLYLCMSGLMTEKSVLNLRGLAPTWGRRSSLRGLITTLKSSRWSNNPRSIESSLTICINLSAFLFYFFLFLYLPTHSENYKYQKIFDGISI